MRRALAVAALSLLIFCPARAETMNTAAQDLPLGGLEDFARENGLALDVRALVARLVESGAAEEAPTLIDSLAALLRNALRDAFPSLLALTAPALMWAACRQLTAGGRLGAAGELVCCLCAAGLLTGLFSDQMTAARQATERIAALIGRFHPVMSAMLSASGAANLAGLMQPAGALASGFITGAMTRAAFALSSAAAVLAVAGNLSERLRFRGLFRLCVSTANWIMGGATTLFLGLMTAGGLLESGRDSMALRAAEYAVDNLLPVIGGDVADTLGAVSSGAALLRRAVGVTGTVLLAGVCLEPMARTIAAVLGCRMAAALAEPAADGPIVECLRGVADAIQLLLVAQAACAAFFLVIAGAGVAAGSTLPGR